MMGDDIIIVVWTVDRQVDERVAISARRWRRRWYLDVRIQNRDMAGRWRATHRGVAFRPTELAGFTAAIGRALDVLRTRIPEGVDQRQAETGRE